MLVKTGWVVWVPEFFWGVQVLTWAIHLPLGFVAWIFLCAPYNCSPAAVLV